MALTTAQVPTVVATRRPGWRRAGGLPPAAGLAGLGLAGIVATDGTPTWQLLRLLGALLATGVVVEALRRLAGPRRAGVALVVGLLVLPVGVGIAVPHVAKSGPPLMASAGLLCLGGGVVLFAGAARLLLGRVTWRGRVLVGPALLLLLWLSLWTIGQAVAATNVPRTSVGARTPADHDLSYVDATFRTSDGVTLSGWYIPSTNGAAVAIAHGAGSTRSGVLDHAVLLAHHGYGVLLFDARGHGDSGGRAMDFGWYGDEDVAAAVSYLAERADVDAGRIGVVGLSMGGEEAIGAAAADARIAAVVAEGAEQRQAADEGWLSDTFGARGWVQEQVERATYAITDLLTDAHPPMPMRAAVEVAAPRPVLLIAGAEAADEERAARFIAAGSPDTVEVWVVPGAGHTAGLVTAPGEWEHRVVAFLDGALP